MVEKANKKHKKGVISEADISSLLQRYTASTLLALLQEVAQFPGVNLDWNALVKKTSTGISNAREYQMLWRHLAYRNALLEKLEDGAQPLDDDSDLEYELEAFPDVSSEASAEAAACVKVLIASGLQSGSNLPNSSTVEAPLTINIPNGQSFRSSSENSQPACLMQGMNITVPVSVQKLPLPTASTEVFGGNGSLSGNMPHRRKRKPWTKEEDIELIDAVKKCGEGNWATILRGDFKRDRTASQLSQRWNTLRKKHGNDITGANSSGSQLSEAQLAARHAMSLALDMPVKNTTTVASTNNSAGAALNPTTNNSMLSATTAEALPAGSSFLQHQSQSQQGPILAKSPLMESPNFSTESSLRATAVAVGARIVTPASRLKVAQTKNAFRMPSGVSSTKAPLTGSATAHSEASSSVHYFRTGLGAASPSSNSAATSTAPQPISVKAASPRVQHNTSSEKTDAAISSPATELPLKSEVKAGEEIKVSDLCTTSGNEPSKEVDTTALPKPDLDLKNREAVAENPNSSMKMEVLENNQVQNSSSQVKANPKEDDKMMGSQVEDKENHSAVKENFDIRNTNEKLEDLSSTLTDGCSDNLEILSETRAAIIDNEMQG